jgi:hypothetical protein
MRTLRILIPLLRDLPCYEARTGHWKRTRGNPTTSHVSWEPPAALKTPSAAPTTPSAALFGNYSPTIWPMLVQYFRSRSENPWASIMARPNPNLESRLRHDRHGLRTNLVRIRPGMDSAPTWDALRTSSPCYHELPTTCSTHSHYNDLWRYRCPSDTWSYETAALHPVLSRFERSRSRPFSSSINLGR